VIPASHSNSQSSPVVVTESGTDLTPKEQPDPRMQSLQQYLDINSGACGKAVRVIVRELGLAISAPHAARLFRQHSGVGIRQYAKAKRLDIAAVKLRGTTQPIKQIAAELGYRSVQDFARAFRKSFHRSPTEYRMASTSGKI
jgi:two-component system response regulator YesN